MEKKKKKLWNCVCVQCGETIIITLCCCCHERWKIEKETNKNGWSEANEINGNKYIS